MTVLALLSALWLQVGDPYWAGMKHRHLVLAYVLTWVVQLGYAAWIWRRWRRASR
jgi:hypothetical protein